MDFDTFTQVVTSAARGLSPEWRILIAAKRDGEDVIGIQPCKDKFTPAQLAGIISILSKGPEPTENAADISMKTYPSADDIDSDDDDDSMDGVDRMEVLDQMGAAAPAVAEYPSSPPAKNVELGIQGSAPSDDIHNTAVTGRTTRHSSRRQAKVSEPPKQLAISNHPDDRLIDIPSLQRISMAYNVRYCTIMCLKCIGAVPMSRVRLHATKGDRIVKIYREGQPVIKERILHGFECPPEVKLKRQILLELAEAMHIPLETVRVRDHDDDDFSLWRNAAIPLPEQVGPIAGLRVAEEGFICTRCPTENPVCSTTYRSLSHHCLRVNPKEGKIYRRGRVQTMSLDGGLMRYFAIPEGVAGKHELSKQTGGKTASAIDAATVL